MWINIAIPAESVEELEDSLEFLTRMSQRQILRHNLAHPFVAGLQYEREPHKQERWQTAIETARRGRGDCEDLAAYLAGWLRVHGSPEAQAFLRQSDVGYHALVRAGGTVIDPSRQLGMGSEG